MRVWTPVALGVCIALSACGGSDAPPVGEAESASGSESGGEESGSTEPDPSDALYDRGRLLDIRITMDPTDWEALRLLVPPNGWGPIGPTCLKHNHDVRYPWYEADLELDGQVVERIGVRKKAFCGSQDTEKPGLKLNLDEYVAGQELEGVDNLTLNNSKQDPAYIRQCLAYDLFAAAGIPASRCNFAHVWVNGVDMGIYVNVEPIKKAYLRRHFDDDEGNLYEGTLSDFSTDWRTTFEKKTNESDPSQPEIDAAIAAVEAADETSVAEVEALFDLPRFIDYWVLETLLGHADGYSTNHNNFHVYGDPSTGRLTILPWGVDQVLGGEASANTNPAGAMVSWLPWKLWQHPPSRDAYLQRLEEVTAQIWDVPALLASVDAMEALIEDVVVASGDPNFAAQVQSVRDAIEARPGSVAAALVDPQPDVPEYPPGPPVVLGTVDATFDTTWGTWEDDPFATGAATLALDLSTEDFGMPVQLGAGAGNNDGKAATRVVAELPDGRLLFVIGQTQSELFESGANLPTIFGGGEGYIITLEGQDAQVVGIIFGELTLSEAGTNDGDPVVGTLVGDVVGI